MWLIVLTWNDYSDTAELLSSIERAGLVGKASTLVVDNGSDPPVAERLRSGFPWIEALRTGSNLGFAGGNNQGAAYASERGATHLCFLNNDTTIVGPDFIESLARGFDEIGPLAAVAPLIHYDAEPDQVWFAGATFDRRIGAPVHQTVWPADAAAVADTGFLTGCCIFVSVETWTGVGPFDEELFLIFEDSDWSMRADALGVRMGVVRDAHLRHKVSRSLADGSSLGLFYYLRNGLIFNGRWFGARMALRFVQGAWLPRVAKSLRRGEPATGLRELAIGLAAIFSVLVGKRGQAGPLTSAIAGRRAAG